MDESTSPLSGVPAVDADARIGRIVEMLCSLTGVKHQELAARVGMQPQSLSSKLKGKRPFRARELEQIATALGFPVSLLHVDPDDVAASLRTPGRSINYR
jgi:transcriptional regulator with XRE-family HTH domain